MRIASFASYKDKSICKIGKYLWFIIICESKNITALFASDKGIGYKSESVVLYNYLYVRVASWDDTKMHHSRV